MTRPASASYPREVPNRHRPVTRGLLAALGALLAVPAVLLLASCGGGGDLAGAASSVASRVSEAGTGLPSGGADDTTNPSEPADVTTPAAPTTDPATVTQTSEVTRTATSIQTQTQTATATTIRTQTATVSPSVTESTKTTTIDAEETVWYRSPWLWLVLLLLALVLVIVIVMASRRASARDTWDDSLAKVGSDAQWLGETFTANLLAQSNPNTLQSVLTSGLPRFDDADQALMQLASQAPDDPRRGHANALRGSLAELRQSLQHVVDLASTGAPADTQRQAAGLVQQAQTQLRGALSANPAAQPPA